jgi:hypothetical protein
VTFPQAWVRHVACSVASTGGHISVIPAAARGIGGEVKGAIASKYRNAGQTCVCANRILVQDGVYDAFTKRLAETAGAIKVADGFEPDAVTGPLIDMKAVEKVARLRIERLDQRAQRRPRHNALHLGKKRRPPRCRSTRSCASAPAAACSSNRVPRMLARNFVPGGTIDISYKDQELETTFAKQLGVPLLLANVTQQVYQMARAAGLNKEDGSSIIKVFERMAGVTIGDDD